MPAKKKSKGRSLDAVLTFNHAMVYTKDVGTALQFYAGRLGLKVLEDFRREGKSVYVRLKSPKGNGTVVLHPAKNFTRRREALLRGPESWIGFVSGSNLQACNSLRSQR